jgi:imidazolonepropionase-like amidohydrolase
LNASLRSAVKIALAPERLFTAQGAALQSGIVVVENGTIAAIVDSIDDREIPVLRLPGTTLMPGLIDAHTHVSIMPSRGDQLAQMRAPADLQLATARPLVLLDLLSGVTTLRCMGQELDVDFRLREEIRSGATVGPDVLCAGVQVAKPGAHGHALTAVSSDQEIERLIEANAARGADLIKIFTTGGVSSVATPASDSPFSAREVRLVADAAHRRGLKLAAHAHGGAGAKLAIENGVDTIEHGALLDAALIDTAATRGLAIVGTFSIIDHPSGIIGGDAGRPEIVGKLEQVRALVAEAWRRIVASGMRIALGTDSMHGCIAHDVARLVDFGAGPARALRAVTSEAAEVCGLTDRGTIAPGRLADLIAVRGNPLEDVRALAGPVLVMKQGRIVHQV